MIHHPNDLLYEEVSLAREAYQKWQDMILPYYRQDKGHNYLCSKSEGAALSLKNSMASFSEATIAQRVSRLQRSWFYL